MSECKIIIIIRVNKLLVILINRFLQAGFDSLSDWYDDGLNTYEQADKVHWMSRIVYKDS